MSKIEEDFRSLGRTEKAKFISQNIDYANANAIAKYISAYLFDVLEDVGNNEYVAMELRRKGCEVTKHKSSSKRKNNGKDNLQIKYSQ